MDYQVTLTMTVTADSPEAAVRESLRAPFEDFTATVTEYGKVASLPLQDLKEWARAKRAFALHDAAFENRADISAEAIDEIEAEYPINAWPKV